MTERDRDADEEWILDVVGTEAAPILAASRAAWGALSHARRIDHLRTLHAIEADLAGAMQHGVDPGDAALSPLLERHRAWIATSWGVAPGATAYAGLADLYAAHPDFGSRYERIAPGFTAFLTAAMRAHAARMAG